PHGPAHPRCPRGAPRAAPARPPDGGSVVDAVADTDHARRPAVDRAEQLSPPLTGRPSLR
ncbi:hypothetical protein, partial [Streptomyces mirabilis]|uniref:hypothetical protein n=1 Tax=Streptomyces mirabilis TaxID=68239 RepID=UPI0036DF4A13